MTTSISDEKLWADIERQIEQAKQSTFMVGDVLLSPKCFRFEVTSVSDEGVATLRCIDGWRRQTTLRWNAPNLGAWRLVERPEVKP